MHEPSLLSRRISLSVFQLQEGLFSDGRSEIVLKILDALPAGGFHEEEKRNGQKNAYSNHVSMCALCCFFSAA